MDISNLHDKQAKIMIIKMLKTFGRMSEHGEKNGKIKTWESTKQKSQRWRMR